MQQSKIIVYKSIVKILACNFSFPMCDRPCTLQFNIAVLLTVYVRNRCNIKYEWSSPIPAYINLT